MRDVSPRLPCPVCVGVQLGKTRIGAGGELVLDHCARCGGIWFELGEVQRLRRLQPDTLWSRIGERAAVARTQCHSCHAPLDRDAEACASCGWRNALECPQCLHAMTVEVHDGLRLDACRNCRGVWFDRAELAAIWTASVDASRRRSAVAAGPALTPGDGALIALDALTYSPELIFYGARAAGYVVANAAEGLSHVPSAAGAVLDGAGDAAASAFEAVLEIIGGLFS